METKNIEIEKAYDLLEQFEFIELSEAEKLYILSVMTESQYNEMRKTISNIKVILDRDIEPVLSAPNIPQFTTKSKFLRFIKYPVQLYQVAASIAIILSTYFIIQKTNHNSINKVLASNDTVFVRQTDTIYTPVYGTGSIKEIATPSHQNKSQRADKNELISDTAPALDCRRELCPNEVGNITILNNTNSIANDSALKGILLSLN
jgi:hypothetical protein